MLTPKEQSEIFQKAMAFARLRWKLRRINEIQAINETVKRAYQ